MDAHQPSSDSVFVWGDNEHGALCLPSDQDESLPRRVLALRAQFLRSVGVGAGFSVAATASNVLLEWGDAGDGLPRPTEGGPETCCALACTAAAAFALSDDGEVHTWTPGSPSWERLRLAVDVELLACGEAHSLALSRDGEVFAWGRGSEGQLGLGMLQDALDRPQLVEPLTGQVVALSCGAAHSVFVSSAGALLGCGRGAVLGGGVAARPQLAPAPIRGPWEGIDAPLVGVACGRAHTLVLVENGQLFSLGEGERGQLGHGGASMGRALRVGGPLASRAVGAVWGSLGDQSFAQTEEGGVYFWGQPPGGGAPVPLPAELAELRDCHLLQLASSGAHVLALSAGGDLHAWGEGASRGLGLQALGAQPSPRRQPSLDRLRIVALSCGDGPHVVALESAAAANRVFAWGRNTHGELGLPRAECTACSAPRIVCTGALGALGGRRSRSRSRSRREPLLGASAGGHFSLVWGLRAESVVGWGARDRMQLGACSSACSSPAPKAAAAATPSWEGGCDDGDDGGGEGGEGEGGGGGVQFAPRRLCDRDGQPLLGAAGGTIVCLSAGWRHAGAAVARGGGGGGGGGRPGGGEEEDVAGVPLLWGCGEGGALGSPEAVDRAQPVEARGSLAGCSVRLLACGRDGGAAVDAAGQLHLWGGGGASGAQHAPRVLPLAAAPGQPPPRRILQLCCAGRRMLVLASGGGGGCGSGGGGGGGGEATAVYEINGGGAARPLRALEHESVAAVACTSDHALAMTLDGRVMRLVRANGGGPGSDGVLEALPLPDRAAPRLLAAAKAHGALVAAVAPAVSSTGAASSMPADDSESCAMMSASAPSLFPGRGREPSTERPCWLRD